MLVIIQARQGSGSILLVLKVCYLVGDLNSKKKRRKKKKKKKNGGIESNLRGEGSFSKLVFLWR